MDNIGFLPYASFMIIVCVWSCTAQCGTYMTTDKNLYMVGENIHITCSTKSSLAPDPSKFYIIHTTKDNPTGANVSAILTVTGNNVTTDIKVRSKQDAGTYICYYGDCKEVLLTSFSSVRVIPNPASLTTPELTCITDNYFNMTCTWENNNSDTVVTWRMQYWTRDSGHLRCCTASGDCDRFTLEPRCSIPPSEFHRYRTYQFELTANYGFETTQVYNYTVRFNDSMLRCTIGDALELSAGLPRQISLATNVDCIPSTVGGVFCHATLTSQNEPRSVLSKNFTSDSDNLKIHDTIRSLEAYTAYNVSLSCRPRPSVHWSSTLYAEATTMSELPEKSPEIFGYSDIPIDQNSRDVFLYVKPNTRIYGRNPEYVLQIDDASKRALDQHTFPATTTTAVLKSLSTTDQYNVTLTSQNEAGSCMTSTETEIPATRPPQISVVVDMDDNGSTSFLLFDSETKTAPQRTCYFTCIAETQTVPPICKTSVRSECEDGFLLSSRWIPTVFSNTGFAAYGAGLQYSSVAMEITWSSCVFRPGRKQPGQKLLVAGKLTSDVAVQLDLNFDYCFLRKRPLVYQIETFHVAVKRNCTFEDYTNITASPTLKTIKLAVDGHSRSVFVCFRAVYSNDEFDTSQVIVVPMETSEDAVVEGVDMKQIIIGISVVVGACSLILLCACMEMYRRRVKSRTLVEDILKDTDLSLSTVGYGGHYNRLSGHSGQGSSTTDHTVDYQRLESTSSAASENKSDSDYSDKNGTLSTYVSEYENICETQNDVVENDHTGEVIVKVDSRDVYEHLADETTQININRNLQPDKGSKSKNCLAIQVPVFNLPEALSPVAHNHYHSQEAEYQENGVEILDSSYSRISRFGSASATQTFEDARIDSYTVVVDSASMSSDGYASSIDSYSRVVNGICMSSGHSLPDYVMSAEMT